MPITRLKLDEIPNSGCKTKCNKQDRLEATENDLCKEVNSVIDELPVRCVGKWAGEKIYHLHQYFGIFAPSMHKKWEINYIEICSGPGRCICREEGIEFNGTALDIIKHNSFKFIHKAIFFDFNSVVVETLNKRIKNANVTNAKAFLGDYFKPQEICDCIKSEISARSLNLVLIDPTDCSVPFELIKHLKNTIPNIDFIINVATNTDFNRNIKNVIFEPEKYKSLLIKYSQFLNGSMFFTDQTICKMAKNDDHKGLRNAFREEYKRNLQQIGYEFFDYKSIHNYYDLLFATSNKKGIEFWEKANRYTFDGQKTIF